jgi:DNA-binding SARP family transcriptional activator
LLRRNEAPLDADGGAPDAVLAELDAVASTHDTADCHQVSLHLLGGPHVVDAGRHVSLPEGSKRLVAFVALNGLRVTRVAAAAVLWPDADRHRAAGNLRSAMWRLRVAGISILQADMNSIWLDPHARVDLQDVSDWADRLARDQARPDDLEFRPAALEALDLLPGWYEDWVLLERERLRQTLLRAVEALACRLVAANRYGEAIEAALSAVSVAPLRESAQSALIEAHLAEGNRCEALRSYSLYEEILDRELGLGPSVELRRLVHQTPVRL